MVEEDKAGEEVIYCRVETGGGDEVKHSQCFA